MNRRVLDGPVVAAGLDPIIMKTAFTLRKTPSFSLVREQSGGGSKKLAALIAQGRDLFFNGTFGGNGRTCGTCHRANRNLTMDSAFIATLAATDPLFVAEVDPNLLDFDANNPTIPSLEDTGATGLMRLQALEAFQLSNRSPTNGDFRVSGRNSLLSTATDPRATDTTRPEVRGRDLFLSVGCTT